MRCQGSRTPSASEAPVVAQANGSKECVGRIIREPDMGSDENVIPDEKSLIHFSVSGGDYY